MVFRVNCRGLLDDGKVFDADVVARYINGYKLRLKSNGDTAFICKSDMVILEATEAELNMPINF